MQYPHRALCVLLSLRERIEVRVASLGGVEDLS
jgi:hypothetical protein